MLASLGYTDADSNGFLDNPAGGDLEVSMIMPPWSAVPQVAQLMQDQWRELGIKLTLVPVPDFPTLLSQVQEGQFNLVAFNTYGVDPAFLNSFYTTGGSRNWTGFSDPELDSILFDAARQLEPGTRVVLYSRAQRIIMDNALIIPIRETVNLNATTNNIQNLTFDPYGWFPLMTNVRWVNP
jgi:peptide/nickel transport system substrate-binding protein